MNRNFEKIRTKQIRRQAGELHDQGRGKKKTQPRGYGAKRKVWEEI